jgi:hypothetical protein
LIELAIEERGERDSLKITYQPKAAAKAPAKRGD